MSQFLIKSECNCLSFRFSSTSSSVQGSASSRAQWRVMMMMMMMMMILRVDIFVDNPSIIFPHTLLGATPHLKRFVIVVVISLSGFRFVVGFRL